MRLQLHPLYTGNPEMGTFTNSAQMKCYIKRFSDKKKGLFLLKLLPNAPRYVQWTILSLLYQIRRQSPLVYKDLNTFA